MFMPITQVALPPALAALVNTQLEPNPDGQGTQPIATQPTATPSSTTVIRLETQTNADGSITTTTTYQDGKSSTSLTPNPNPKTVTNALDPANSAQLGALLNAQEQSRAHTVITFGQSPYGKA
jgi:hypothetical protein